MKTNMGTADRILRLLAVAGIAVLYGLGYLSGSVAIILGGLAVIFLATSLVGVCPLYLPFGLSTARKKLSGG